MTKTIVVCMLFLVLASCGNEQSHQSTDEAERTVNVGGEDFQVPNDPERIVTDFYAGELLTVDANVVGAGSIAFDNPFLEEELAGVEDIGEPPNVEKILELDPDLIVAMYDDNIDQLEQIAPTVHIPYNTATNVEDMTEMFGDIVGAEEEAQAFLNDYHNRADEAREEIEDLVPTDATFGLYEITNDNELYVFGENFGRGGQVLYDALDLDAPDIIEDEVMDEEDVLMLSQEVVPEYAADYMFLTSYDPENQHDAKDELEESSVWQGLDAVQQERYRLNDYDTFYPYDPISVYHQIDLFVDMIREMEAEG
ncbi:iron complex transport system substrate-binding protein [Natribacillus halophilus]|uniref:Iron complex transport system substrate-binding protein n=2 Tax=Natribacillus halophilus TaxID=549003 RepID=A0A1G8SNG1_9BACI|nr:iron-hydroxamate ABC transporter substrate-binding protein [Natribacillus halophilus]SDJ30779.1 iron complex transport system substrate-binding protein [Natribacillus halophilus]